MNKYLSTSFFNTLYFLGERDDFKITLDGLQKQQVLAFGATSLEEGAYKSGYSYISKLHALSELQQVEKVLSDLLISPNNKEYGEAMMKKLLNEWSLRIKVKNFYQLILYRFNLI